MSDRVSDQCQHDFCSRTFFLIYSVRCVILPFLFAKPVPKTLNRKCVNIYTNMIDAIVVDVLLVCTKTLPRGIHLSPDSPHNEPEKQNFDLSFVVSLDNCWTNSRVAGDLTWRLFDVTPILTLCEGTAGYILLTKGQWCWTWMLSLMSAWPNGWANSRTVVDWRPHDAQITSMYWATWPSAWKAQVHLKKSRWRKLVHIVKTDTEKKVCIAE